MDVLVHEWVVLAVSFGARNQQSMRWRADRQIVAICLIPCRTAADQAEMKQRRD